MYYDLTGRGGGVETIGVTAILPLGLPIFFFCFLKNLFVTHVNFVGRGKIDFRDVDFFLFLKKKTYRDPLLFEYH